MDRETKSKNTYRREFSPSARPALRLIYRKLSVYFDFLQASENYFADPPRRACVAVLEEDISALLQECEEYLIPGLEPEVIEYSSFATRTDTVLEEVDRILSADTRH